MSARRFDSGDFWMLVHEQEKEDIRKQEEKRIHEVELKTLRDDITIIKADVFTILYRLYKFTMKPNSMDFDTFYKSRFCGRLREKIDKVME